MNWLIYNSLAVCLLGHGSTAKAHDQDCIHHHHGPLPPSPRTACDAGHPFSLSKHAARTDETHHHGYMVGGGSTFGGSGFCPDEGTFGWDYTGHLTKINLGFSHGWLFQNGGGPYRQETSKPISTFLRSLRD